MKRIKVEVECPACKKAHRVIAAKPGLLTPTRLNVKCPMCETKTIYRFDQARGTGVKHHNLVNVKAIGFRPSVLFLEAWEQAEKEANSQKGNENVESNNILGSDISNNDVVQSSEGGGALSEGAGSISQDSQTSE